MTRLYTWSVKLQSSSIQADDLFGKVSRCQFSLNQEVLHIEAAHHILDIKQSSSSCLSGGLLVSSKLAHLRLKFWSLTLEYISATSNTPTLLPELCVELSREKLRRLEPKEVTLQDIRRAWPMLYDVSDIVSIKFQKWEAGKPTGKKE